MKYINANDVLPAELLSRIQEYYQGGYLYIPRELPREVRRQTDYKVELEKRNHHIYLKHVEGRTNGQIGKLYHLSKSSVRRILAEERRKYRKMRERIERILPFWGMEIRQLSQIYPSAWEVNHSYVMKVYSDRKQLERNIKISEILAGCNIPVAEIVPAKTGEKFVEQDNFCFFLSRKLPGSNIADIKDKEMTRKMGCAIARLHKAFLECEKEIAFWDNSLLDEMKGWVGENLARNAWEIVDREAYWGAVEALENVYGSLPKQLIHRDVHFGNFLFFQGSLSGYIDFDLSQRNIRIFDICYFLTGLLAEETEEAFTKKEWIENVGAAIAGYEGIARLSGEEKAAIPCVMECIEILFAAYFIGLEDFKHAKDAWEVFLFIRDCEEDI